MDACPGPLVWFTVDADHQFEAAAVLECAAPGCGYIIATGGVNDADHCGTDLLLGA